MRAALALGLLSGAGTLGHAQTFQPGEILVSYYNGAKVQRYSSAGTLLQTFTGTGGEWTGLALAPSGNLVTSYRSPGAGINIFSPSGTQIVSFPAPRNGTAADVGVFANGTIAFNDATNNTVQFWSQAGALLQTVSLPGVSGPFGSTVGSDGILYVGGYLSNNLGRIDSNGNFLGLINLGFRPGDVEMNPLDGTLWVTGYDNQTVAHIQTNGTVLGSFFAGGGGFFSGIALDEDYNSLYVTHGEGSSIQHFDLNGTLLGSFNLTSPNNPTFLTVVPVPEPGSIALLLIGLARLAARCRLTV